MPETLKAMQQLGLARTYFCLLPRANTLRLAYPTLRWYHDMPVPKNDAAILKAKPKLVASADGRRKNPRSQLHPQTHDFDPRQRQARGGARLAGGGNEMVPRSVRGARGKNTPCDCG